ncbi:MAG: DUF72 domain-containing protein [Planctomycetes bacterium]|nr:DUF72 domain-containing protein [Planctomycetota bacterium]
MTEKPPSDAAVRRIRVGTSGWSYADWAGVFYPLEKPRGFDELAYLARFFDAVEVNSSFYRPPTARMGVSWLRRTPPGFEFTYKLYQRFTHERPPAWTPADVAEYKEGVEPVRAAGRLGAVLVQFPWSFRADDEAFRHLEAVRRDFGDLPLVVEVRHVSWTGPQAVRFLKDAGLGFCCIDQPLSRSGVPPMTLVTSPVGYVRLHGRNREAWFKRDAGRDERYNYLYREEELQEWIERIHEIARASQKTYVFTNNHYRGQAPANALQILSKLRGGPVPVPAPLLKEFPFLEAVAAEGLPPGGQGELF